MTDSGAAALTLRDVVGHGARVMSIGERARSDGAMRYEARPERTGHRRSAGRRKGDGDPLVAKRVVPVVLRTTCKDRASFELSDPA